MKIVEKTIEILEAFLKYEGEVGIAELARLVGLNISTTHRIISTLVKRGYLNQQQKRGKYSLAYKFLEFGSAIRQRMKIEEVALPFLTKLNKTTNESVRLGVLDRDEVVCIAEIESSLHLRILTRVGTRFPLHCTSAGKIFLAYMSEEEVERYVKNKGLSYYTDNTIREYSKLEKELLTIRHEDIAIDREEFNVGVNGISAPIKEEKGDVVATATVSGPSTRLSNNRMQEIKELVMDYCSEISKAIGYGNK